MLKAFKISLVGLLLGASMATLVQAASPTLYDNLGGKPAIVAVVDEFVSRVAADKRINDFFAGVTRDPQRLASFKGKLVDQICQATLPRLTLGDVLNL